MARTNRASYSTEDIQMWLSQKIADRLRINVNHIDVREDLMNYGLSSRELVRISGELEKWLEFSLSPTLLYDHPSIESLSRHLAERMN